MEKCYQGRKEKKEGMKGGKEIEEDKEEGEEGEEGAEEQTLHENTNTFYPAMLLESRWWRMPRVR